VKIFNKIEESLQENLPFVAYKKPNKDHVLAFFQQNDTLHVAKNYKEKGFVFAPFDDEKESILIPVSNASFIEEQLKLETIPLKTSFDTDKESKQFHVNIVEKGIEAIKNKQFKKVVLSRKEGVKKNNFDVISTLKKLLTTYKNAFVYVWFHPKVGLWMGATPETLIKIHGNSFETMSLAGTQVCKEEIAVKWQDKEMHEQQLVTDYVLQKLKPICKLVKASAVKTVKAGNLLHLKTIIKGELDDNPSTLIHLLHPTPAVCGFPKNESKDFIMKNEGYDRRFYTGFLGELNMPNSELFVNLRCMEITKENINIYVGGGITKESDSIKEWKETVAKAITMKRVL